jgi:hypothetical protein
VDHPPVERARVILTGTTDSTRKAAMNALPRFAHLGWARRALCAAALVTVMSLTTTGCSVSGGYVTWKAPNGTTFRIGEQANTIHGRLVVLYRSTGGRHLGVSQFLLDKYKQERKHHSVKSASIRTLRWLSGYCGGSFKGVCLRATSDDRWSDFHSALSDVNRRPGACIAVTVSFRFNWTFRNRTDTHCKP